MGVPNAKWGGGRAVIGMVHLLPLPGSPGFAGDMGRIFEAAKSDLEALVSGGVDAVIVENFGDVPYSTQPKEMARIAQASLTARLREICPIPMGVNVQFNDWEAEWAIAYACDCDFVRVEVLAENRMGPNGFCAPSGPEFARMRARFPANVAVLADIQVKHTFPAADQPLDFTLSALCEAGADAVICTGLVTGKSPDIDEVAHVRELAGTMPLLVGSGVNAQSIADYLAVADGVIVGSSVKEDGKVTMPVDEMRVRNLVNAAREEVSCCD